jgi:putative NADPH-quinone reductase
MSKIAIIVGHARKDTYCEALGEAYRRGAIGGGHSAALFVTSRMVFDPVLHTGYGPLQPLEPDLQAAFDMIASADHIVLIYPLWIGAFPAIFKGFLERILQPHLVSAKSTGEFPKPWKGKSARVILTMGMPSLVYRWYYGAHSLQLLKRNILRFVGVGTIRSTIYGMIDTVTPARRGDWLAEVEAMGRRAE